MKMKDNPFIAAELLLCPSLTTRDVMGQHHWEYGVGMETESGPNSTTSSMSNNGELVCVCVYIKGRGRGRSQITQ